ncbi:MAG: hypothetical protein AAGK37_08470 [Pseudomonadota bacterium]
MTRGFLFLAGVFLGAVSFAGGFGLGLAQIGNGPSDDNLRAVIQSELAQQTEDLASAQTAENATQAQLAADLAALRAQLTHGFVTQRTVEVTEARVAYHLIEPKLMLSVEGLPGGALIVNFANQTRSMRVAQTVEFAYGPCRCYLLLTASTRGQAVFDFGCEEAEGTPGSTEL